MIGYIREIFIPMMAVMVLALVLTGCSAGETAKTPALIDGKTDKTTDPRKLESVFSKATGVTSNTPTPILVPTATALPTPTPMPVVIAPGAVPTSVPTPFPNRDLVGMPLLVNGKPLEAYQDAFAFPCGFMTLHPPANKNGMYYQGTKITVSVHSLNLGTTVILGVANSSGGNTPTGTIHARNAEPYSITAAVTPCSSPVTITSYNTYNPVYYILLPTPMPTSTLPPLTPRPYSLTSIRQYLSDGQRLYSLGRFDAAMLEFNQIILSRRSGSEGSQEAYTWRAKSHIALGNWRAALKDVGEALAVDPTDVEGYRGRGDAYKTLNVELFRLRATIYMELNSYEPAILALNEVILRDPTPTAGDYNSRGYAHYMHEHILGPSVI